MKVEIAILCIDDGRVPRHKILTWEVKGNESRDRRMQRLHDGIAKMLKTEFPHPGKTPPPPAEEVDPCLVKREPGEPMFVLLARDLAAQETLEHWCRLRKRGIAAGYWPDTPQEHEHIAQVRAKIAVFQAWRMRCRS